jgi:uncharacterized membrane protein YqiK
MIIGMRRYQKTRRSKRRNRKTRKHSGGDEWNHIGTRLRSTTQPLLAPPKVMENTQRITTNLSNAREPIISGFINQELVKNARIRQFYENVAARASAKAAVANAKVNAERSKAEANAAKAAELQATMKGLLSKKLKKEVKSKNYYGPKSRINQNKEMEQYLTNYSNSKIALKQ